MKLREEKKKISTGQEIRTCKVLRDFNNSFKEVPEIPFGLFVLNFQILKQNNF